MRGFIVGSLALIVLQVLLQPGTADKIGLGSGVLVNGLHRFLSGDVAGIPQRKTSTTAGKPATGGGF